MADLSLCRICAKQQAQNLVKLFEDSKKKLINQIKRLTGKTLLYDKDLPQYICEKCQEDLKKALEFRLRVLSVQEYFTTPQYLEKLKLTRENPKPENIKNTIKTIKSKVPSGIVKHQIAQSNNERNNQAVFVADGPTNDIDMDPLENLHHSDEMQQRITEDISNELAVEEEKDEKDESMICDMCGIIFKNHCSLKKHIYRHVGEPQFQCEFCEYKSYENYSMKIHRRCHTGERPFPCSYCKKGFTNKKSMQKHIRIHENVRPYACTYCDKTFPENNNLNKHLISHTGISRFNCDTCRKVFQSNALLVKHYKSVGHLQNLAIQNESNEVK